MDTSYGPYRHTQTGAEDFGGGWYLALPAPPDYLEGRAITTALKKLKGMDLNTLQALAERKQTARLVRGSIDASTRKADDVWREIRKLERSNIKPGLLAKRIAALWLAYQYGIRPLVMDAFGAVSELMDNEEISSRYRVKCVGTAYENYDFTRGPFAGGAFLQYLVSQHVRGTCRVKVRLDYEADNVALARAARLGITNPALLTWELLPYSFVADWYLPIGSYLSLLDATNGWTFKGGTCSTMQRQNTRPYGVQVRYPENGQTGFATASGRGTEIYLQRKVYASSPFPNRPYLDDRSSGTHVMNGIALLTAALAGRR